MPGPIAPYNRRFSIILHRAQRAWLDSEAKRVDAGLTAADILRGALAHFQDQPAREREALARRVARERMRDEEAGEGRPRRPGAP